MPGNNEQERQIKHGTGRKDKEGLTVRSLHNRDKETEAMEDEEGQPVKQIFRGRQEDRMTEQYSKGVRDNDEETKITRHRERQDTEQTQDRQTERWKTVTERQRYCKTGG